jgi:hypothetical protein
LLRRCLEKDPKKRLRDISGVELLLKQAPDEVQRPAGLASRWAWIIAIGFCGFGAIGAIIFQPRQANPPRILKLSLMIPEGANFHIRGSTPQISPDGRRVVLSPPIEGKADLWVRDLDSLKARMLPGTSDASFPFWSPDSRWVGFFSKDKLKKIDVTGGPAVTVCNVRDGRGGSWSQNGAIVYATLNDGLLRVAADGGTPAVIVVGGLGHADRYPWFFARRSPLPLQLYEWRCLGRQHRCATGLPNLEESS